MKGKYNFTHIKKWNNPILFGQGGRANHMLTTIEDMRVKGNVLTGYHMTFITTYPISIFDYYLIVDIEKALKTKEIL